MADMVDLIVKLNTWAKAKPSYKNRRACYEGGEEITRTQTWLQASENATY